MQLLKKITPIVLIILGASNIVSAHPHIFIDTLPTFIFDESRLSVIKVKWIFDEGFSEQILECDTDKDNKFDKEEMKSVEEDFFSYTENVNYFSV